MSSRLKFRVIGFYATLITILAMILLNVYLAPRGPINDDTMRYSMLGHLMETSGTPGMQVVDLIDDVHGNSHVYVFRAQNKDLRTLLYTVVRINEESEKLFSTRNESANDGDFLGSCDVALISLASTDTVNRFSGFDNDIKPHITKEDIFRSDEELMQWYNWISRQETTRDAVVQIGDDYQTDLVFVSNCDENALYTTLKYQLFQGVDQSKVMRVVSQFFDLSWSVRDDLVRLKSDDGFYTQPTIITEASWATVRGSIATTSNFSVYVPAFLAQPLLVGTFFVLVLGLSVLQASLVSLLLVLKLLAVNGLIAGVDYASGGFWYVDPYGVVPNAVAIVLSFLYARQINAYNMKSVIDGVSDHVQQVNAMHHARLVTTVMVVITSGILLSYALYQHVTGQYVVKFEMQSMYVGVILAFLTVVLSWFVLPEMRWFLETGDSFLRKTRHTFVQRAFDSIARWQQKWSFGKSGYLGACMVATLTLPFVFWMYAVIDISTEHDVTAYAGDRINRYVVDPVVKSDQCDLSSGFNSQEKSHGDKNPLPGFSEYDVLVRADLADRDVLDALWRIHMRSADEECIYIGSQNVFYAFLEQMDDYYRDDGFDIDSDFGDWLTEAKDRFTKLEISSGYLSQDERVTTADIVEVAWGDVADRMSVYGDGVAVKNLFGDIREDDDTGYRIPNHIRIVVATDARFASEMRDDHSRIKEMFDTHFQGTAAGIVVGGKLLQYLEASTAVPSRFGMLMTQLFLTSVVIVVCYVCLPWIMRPHAWTRKQRLSISFLVGYAMFAMMAIVPLFVSFQYYFDTVTNVAGAVGLTGGLDFVLFLVAPLVLLVSKYKADDATYADAEMLNHFREFNMDAFGNMLVYQSIAFVPSFFTGAYQVEILATVLFVEMLAAWLFIWLVITPLLVRLGRSRS